MKRKNLKESEFYKFLENVFLKEYGFCSKQETINTHEIFYERS